MVAENDLVKYQFNNRTTEEQREIAKKGGIASGKARKEKATMKQMLEMCLNMKNENGQTYRELATLGLIKGAVTGNSNNYRTILETLGELEALREERQVQQLTRVEELLTKLDEEAMK